MTYYPLILADSGFLFAYYSARDQYHQQVRRFFEKCTSRLVTTPICIAEVVWLLNFDWRTQNEFLLDVAKQLYECEQLLPQDFSRIAELNTQYRDLPGDFADLSLIVIRTYALTENTKCKYGKNSIYRRGLAMRFTPTARIYLQSK